jgi:hypothetical protein
VQKWSQRTIVYEGVLANKQITVLELFPCSPDLAENDFSLFLKIKEILNGKHFDGTDDIRSNMMAALKAIPQNQFQNCFEVWARHWHQCITSQGQYFEGDHSDIQQFIHFHFSFLVSIHICYYSNT